MKTSFLFPHSFKKWGWIMFVPALTVALGLSLAGLNVDENFTVPVFAIASDEFMGKSGFFVVTRNSVSDEILLCLIIIGGLLVGFSKVRNEDEMISRIRYESLVWAVYLNFALMLLATLFIYGMYFFQVMMFNLFALLFFFILRFHIKLYQLNRQPHEE